MVIDENRAGMTLPRVLPGDPVIDPGPPTPQGGGPRPEKPRRSEQAELGPPPWTQPPTPGPEVLPAAADSDPPYAEDLPKREFGGDLADSDLPEREFGDVGLGVHGQRRHRGTTGPRVTSCLCWVTTCLLWGSR